MDLGQKVRGWAGHGLEVGSGADLRVLVGILEDDHQLLSLCIT